MVKRLLVSAVALTMAAVPGVAFAKRDSGMRAMPLPAPGVWRHNWGPRRDGRWIGGWRAPGGWGAYRPAVRGYVLPRYWINPRFYVSNWGRYGLYQPAPGYGWSRYYDDMVLTDSAGSIIDSRHAFDWDRYDRYDADGWDDWDNGGREYAENENGYDGRDDRPAPPPPPRRYKDKDGGLGGAAIGAVGGAALGAMVGGKGDRVEGAVIGGVAGAVAGGLIDKGDRYGRGPKEPSKAERRRWEDERAWGARVDNDYGYGADYDAPPVDHGDRRHWGNNERHATRSGPRVYHHEGGSTQIYRHDGYGYGYGGGETVITIHSVPVVTTTTTTTEEYVYASAPRKRHAARKKVWKPRPKARCVC